ncbi:Peroxidase [Corchorus olitorius]|uniref:Peroxidase n=1 Tax=Corchorus olitorius TaxID=93759 RepID=A0A1R3G329_9ROSI|nr:Peroxidase [Corchorus olitorius]
MGSADTHGFVGDKVRAPDTNCRRVFLIINRRYFEFNFEFHPTRIIAFAMDFVLFSKILVAFALFNYFPGGIRDDGIALGDKIVICEKTINHLVLLR